LYIGGAILSISFQRELDDQKFRHSIFTVLGHFPPLGLNYAFGVSINVNASKRCIGRTEVLIYTTDNFDDVNTTFKEYFIDSAEFIEEDKKYKGKLNWLTGKYNRLVTSPASPDVHYSTRKNAEYVDVHFFAACYLARKGDWQNSLTNLYQAYLHGFYNLESLEEELKPGGCLYELEKLDDKKAVPGTNSHYFKELNCKDLVARIRSRAAHIQELPPNEK
jgi:hypothetical protein